MLDDLEARRALEREAIALVNLSNSKQSFTPTDMEEETNRKTQQQTTRKSRAPINHSSKDSSRDSTSIKATDDDANISMRSLLVTLKKRKLDRTTDEKDAQRPAPSTPAADVSPAASPGSVDVVADVDVDPRVKLPSFRALFYETPPSTADSSVSASSSGTGSASASASTVAMSTELKCKYRTGKCHNVRALKSCGDYHNLCNYHRLRANANQRKLDRKKKVQRMQLSVALAASAEPSTSAGTDTPSASSTRSAANPSHAAAVALVAMPSSLPAPHAPPQLRYDPKTLVPYLVTSPAAEDVQAKQETIL